MKRIIFLPFLFLYLQVFGQLSNSGEFIAVIGKSSGSYIPDMVTFNFLIKVTDKKQQIAIQKLEDLSDKTTRVLISLGYDPKQIKLSDYTLREDIDYLYGERPKNNGYSASMNFALEIKYTEKDFNTITDSISASNISDLNFTYRSSFSEELKDKIKKELISKASDDAQNIALILAKSRNVIIGDIYSIEYTDNNFNLYGRGILPPPPSSVEFDAMDRPIAASSRTIKEIFTEQQVRIIYRIKKQ